MYINSSTLFHTVFFKIRRFPISIYGNKITRNIIMELVYIFYIT